MNRTGIVLGIDASRNRSGGAKAHLIGIISEGWPADHGISRVHVWSYQSLLDSLPTRSWLSKHNPPELQKSLLRQIYWQRYRFPAKAASMGCDIVLNCDAGTVSRFRPAVTMSRDMLSYEPGAMGRYGISKARLRLVLLRYIQNTSLRHSDGAIFLTKYAARVIQESCGALGRVTCVPHGVGADFKSIEKRAAWPTNGERPIRCIYVSNTAMYKHQWEVVRAIGELRSRGHGIELTLVGGGAGRAQKLLEEQIQTTDPRGEFIRQLAFLPQSELPAYLSDSDISIFASSCEAFGITLLESMAAGLPIACSDRGPMPELLQDGGVYFNPEDYLSIADAIHKIVSDPIERDRIALRAKALSTSYSWGRCANDLFRFIADTLSSSQSNYKPSPSRGVRCHLNA